jgi:hypothetical protein
MSFPLVHYLSCVVHAFLPTPPVKETGKTSCMTSARSVVRLYWGVGWGFTPVVRKTKLKKCVAPAKRAHRKGTLRKNVEVSTSVSRLFEGELICSQCVLPRSGGSFIHHFPSSYAVQFSTDCFTTADPSNSKSASCCHKHLAESS